MVVALIPARSGSKGVANKNIKPLGGYPLLQWSIAACQKSEEIKKIIVSTDSEYYADLAIKLGAEAPFIRPKSLSGDFSTDLEFIEHALSWMKKNDLNVETIVHVRPTTPFRDPFLIDQAIKLYNSLNDITSLRSVHEMSESSYKTFEIDNKSFLKSICTGNYDIDSQNNARQEFPKTYVANGYVDILSAKFIKEKKILHGNKCFAYKTDFCIEVDTIDDFSLLEFEITRKPELLSLIEN